MLEAIEYETGNNPQWVILWLHGLGADGHDFFPITSELVQSDWPEIRFVFPHAPMRHVTINNGILMRAWYDVYSLGGDRGSFESGQVDDIGITESTAQIERLIHRESTRGIHPDRLILVGFSQGGAMVLSVGLRRKEPLAGLVALSSYLPMASELTHAMDTSACTQPVFIAHGLQDSIVPYPLGKESASTLDALGFSVQWHDYAMEHSVCEEEISDLRAWLNQRFLLNN